MFAAQIAQQLPKLQDLAWIQPDSRLVQNQDLRFPRQQLRHSHALAIALGQVPDQAIPGVQNLCAGAESINICP